MKILLLGKNGQLGWELQRSLAPLGEVIALDRNSQDFCGDLIRLEDLAATIRQIKPAIIVNAAAYTAVDKAESETELAQTINADAVAVLAQEAKLLDAWLVHFSTDYVFAGNGTRAWQETDKTGPLNIYGVTKLAGEKAIQESACKHLIFRTSWVYGARGNNFAKTMLRLATERDSLTVIRDQVGAPTGADLIADVTAHAVRTVQVAPELSGLYHLVAAGETSWHGYACYVIKTAQKMGQKLKITVDAIAPVATSAFPTPAKRPENSRLNTGKVEANFALTLPHWQIGVTRMLTEFLEK
ncbi:MAG: dTDP-4-dehydrorhamnose reductase [Gammaproteobacteria bacterium]|nr:dTDP-4-dehydrorhamnose reductase [Gammaproteobacteria bacterium]MBT5827140.1 dTDP-4-dehydrorhamnose reductase [Gammaproteobacteria bacterium]MBT5967007.1 dTDP-4-dehydrorhamnose reductase [Gammaproteobacteria bacterium]MBT6420387.1 dTDP-4-dehydrorhamnose reductase [Gammaproteobacteria bacterium]MBT6574778.1 dTDP-4-dehydrorhamnose reductase [Gammaproteobacteria bacterium]